jgi:hypothetical protein
MSLDTFCHIEVKQGASFIKCQNLSRYMVLGVEIKVSDVENTLSFNLKKFHDNLTYFQQKIFFYVKILKIQNKGFEYG